MAMAVNSSPDQGRRDDQPDGKLTDDIIAPRGRRTEAALTTADHENIRAGTEMITFGSARDGVGIALRGASLRTSRAR